MDTHQFTPLSINNERYIYFYIDHESLYTIIKILQYKNQQFKNMVQIRNWFRNSSKMGKQKDRWNATLIEIIRCLIIPTESFLFFKKCNSSYLKLLTKDVLDVQNIDT